MTEQSLSHPPLGEDACRFCGDPAVVFRNRLGAHCGDCYQECREAAELHEAGP